MIKAVYICQEPFELFYKLRLGGVQEFVDASDLSFKDFCNYHIPNLNPNRKFICLYNINYSSTDLIKLVPKVVREVIWVFPKLKKSDKLYKDLSVKVGVEEVDPIDTPAKKRKAIREIITLEGLDPKLEHTFYLALPESRSIILSEINKYKKVLNIVGKDQALKSITWYNNDIDLLDCISSLNRLELRKFYSLVGKVSTLPVQVIHSTLLKKIKSLQLLSLNMLEESKEIWRSSGVFLEEDKALAGELGINKLVDFYLFCDQSLSEYGLSEIQISNRLMGIFRYYSRLRPTSSIYDI